MRLRTPSDAGARSRLLRAASLAIIAVSLLTGAAALAPADAAARGACANETSSIFSSPSATMRLAVLCLVNETRLQRGLPALRTDARLQTAAQQHTDDMVTRGYLAHPSPPPNPTTSASRISAAGYTPAATTGENLAQGNATPVDVVEGWMDELGAAPGTVGHCQNILSPAYRDLGVGVNPGVADPAYSAGTWTQDFGRLTSQAAPSTATAPSDGCPYTLAPISAGNTPVAGTTAATGMTASSATVNGTTNANGGGFTSYHVEYGMTKSYGSQTLERGAGTTTMTVTEPLSGLAAGTYHFRVLAMNQNGETGSVDRVFTTAGSLARPLVDTEPATSVTQTSAALNGSVNPAGKATTYHFEYGTTTGYGNSTTSASAGSDTIAQAVSASPSTLSAGITYHFRLVASNGDGATNGADTTFTTPAPPVVVTGVATAVGRTTATLDATVNPRGTLTTYHFDYGTTTSYGASTAATSAGSGMAAQPQSATLSGLAAGTTYHFSVVASNADGTSTGADASFTTLDPPEVVTTAANAGLTTAALNGTVDANAKATTYHFDYGPTIAYGSSTASASATGSTPQPVSAALSGLDPGTTYHFRVVATNGDGTTNGADVTMTTSKPPLLPPPFPGVSPPPPPVSRVIPSVAGARVSPASFRAARSGASVTAAAVRGSTRTKVSYVLNVPALVRFAAERATSGRRVGGRCVSLTRINRSRAPCTRYLRVSGSFSRVRGAGSDRFTFTGRIAGRALRPARYRLLVTPANGTTARVRFRIVASR